MNQRSNTITEEELKKEYDEGLTLHQVAAKYNMTVVTLWRKAKKLGLKWSEKKQQFSPKVPLSEILDGKHPSFQTFKLKKRLIKEGIMKNECQICGIIDWQGKPLNMQLDHIDGDSHNHKRENLRLICPNCHSLTETYCGKNKTGNLPM